MNLLVLSLFSRALKQLRHGSFGWKVPEGSQIKNSFYSNLWYHICQNCSVRDDCTVFLESIRSIVQIPVYPAHIIQACLLVSEVGNMDLVVECKKVCSHKKY